MGSRGKERRKVQTGEGGVRREGAGSGEQGKERMRGKKGRCTDTSSNSLSISTGLLLNTYLACIALLSFSNLY